MSGSHNVGKIPPTSSKPPTSLKPPPLIPICNMNVSSTSDHSTTWSASNSPPMLEPLHFLANPPILDTSPHTVTSNPTVATDADEAAGPSTSNNPTSNETNNMSYDGIVGEIFGLLAKLEDSKQKIAELKGLRRRVYMQAALQTSKLRMMCELAQKRALDEAKLKKWCVVCGSEAEFRCCWNTYYCAYSCQRPHWPQHALNCEQLNLEARDAAASIVAPLDLSSKPSNETTTAAEARMTVVPMLSIPVENVSEYVAVPPAEGPLSVTGALYREIAIPKGLPPLPPLTPKPIFTEEQLANSIKIMSTGVLPPLPPLTPKPNFQRPQVNTVRRRRRKQQFKENAS